MSKGNAADPMAAAASEELRARLLARVPDVPRWVETRSLLLSGRGDAIAADADGSGFLVRSTTGPLLCVVGRPPLEPLQGLLREPMLGVILCTREISSEIAGAVPGWRRTTAVIHSLAETAQGSREGPAAMVSMLSRDDRSRLDHLPARLHREITDALDSGHVAAAFLEGIPVSFCYTGHETETLWDVSIDTLAPYRRRGLAYACAEFLIEHMRSHGKSPVWGALEENAGSLRLARTLGFEAVDRMSILIRPGFDED